MSYARIAAKVYSSQWAIQPSMLASLLTVLHSRISGEFASSEVLASLPRKNFSDRYSVARYTGTTLSAADIPALGDAAEKAEPEAPEATGSTVVIFGSGILGKHLSSMEEMCAGGLSVDRLQESLNEAAADPSIKNIVLWLDTPGGVVTGIPETADLVSRICETKNVVAYCDSLCASAGYWIASACDYIYATRSADLGSVGVYSALYDVSALYAKEGVRVELFKDGAYKAAGFPGTTLTDEQRAEILDGVMQTSKAFKADVKKNRPACTDATLQGQCFTGVEAVKAGLADCLVTGIAEVLADLAQL